MREKDSSSVSCEKPNISIEHEESGSVGTYTKQLIYRWCLGVHFTKKEMHEAWLGFSASKHIKKETVLIDMVIMAMQLALFSHVFESPTESPTESHFLNVLFTAFLPVSLVIRVAFYVFVLVPDNFACCSPWTRVKYFPRAAFLSLLMFMIILQIQLGNVLDSMYLDFDDLSRTAWDKLCLEGSLDTSTNQTCVIAHGGVSSGGETSTFMIQSKMTWT